MKKVYGYLGLFVLAVLLSSNFVVAETGFEYIFGGTEGFFSNLFSDTGEFNAPNWLKGNNVTILMLGILLWMILYAVVKKSMGDLFGHGGLMTGSISLIITVITFIFFKDHPTFLKIAEGQIGALGATILTVFPFILAIYFTVWVSDNLAVARGIWAVFALYYFYILIFVVDLGEGAGIGWYVVGVIAAIILFIAMPFIRDKFWDIKLDSLKEKMGRKLDTAAVGTEALASVPEKFSDGGGI